MNKNSRWPIIICAALALHVVAWLAVAYLAVSDPSFAVEEDYYQKAIDWDEKMAQDKTNRSLGWMCEIHVESQSPGMATLSVHLLDDVRSPVVGATVEAQTFPVARSSHLLQSSLTENGDGRYEAPLAMERPGRWEVRLIAQRNGSTFTHAEVLYFTPTPRIPRDTNP
ncbi:MAG: hypothetical protein GY906_35290 [bacterium]|nr:hypothetical protein [bacterium]